MNIRTAKAFFISSGLLLGTTHANAADWTEQATAEQYCEQWRFNAVYGAQQHLRGASRLVEHVRLEEFVALLEHQLDAKMLYVLEDETTPNERRFSRSVRARRIRPHGHMEARSP